MKTVLLVSYLLNFFSNYLINQTFTNFIQVEEEDDLEDGFEFPSLTFCQNYPFTYRKMDQIPIPITKKDLRDLRDHIFPVEDPVANNATRILDKNWKKSRALLKK